MSIATEITRLQTAKADLKTALEAKGATIPSETTLDGYPDIVDDIPVALLQDKEVSISGGTTVIEPDTGYTGMHSVTVTASGGSPVEEKTVNFIDYEGTIVASYTGTEVQALTTLPNAPDHSEDEVPLTFEEWNWTLANIKSYNTSYPEATIWVGANYHTTDGKIHLFYRIDTNYDEYGVKFALNGSGTVDWGDGSVTESFSAGTVTHVYNKLGYYHCIIDSQATIVNTIGSNYGSIAFCSKVERIYFPTTITSFGDSAFMYWKGITYIAIPSSVNSIGQYAFYDSSLECLIVPKAVDELNSDLAYTCNSLRKVSLPYAVNHCNSDLFKKCYALRSITIPTNTLGMPNFMECYSLRSIVIPDNIKSVSNSYFYDNNSLQSAFLGSGIVEIRANAFYGCYGMSNIVIKATTPPTLGSTSAFNSTYLKKIYVPAGSVEDYKAATNWSTFASIIEAIPS